MSFRVSRSGGGGGGTGGGGGGGDAINVQQIFANGRKRVAEIPVEELDGDVLELTPLGAGNEVGRSCILLEFKGKKVMVM